MRRLARGRVLAGLGLLIALTLVLVARWLNANKIGGQGPAEPFRIAGNFYYVGATDVSAFLITGPKGRTVVLDAGYPTTAKLIHGERRETRLRHQGCQGAPELGTAPLIARAGSAVLQEASGTKVWASHASADSLAAGGDDADAILPLRALV